ncbi:FecCD family ABC transporter permease [Thermococcus nautili]|uniref:ABC-type Fe3+-siderophore transport system, permease component n=1 Tax=Thermococcus nautili TaxID=195522 RepID=W8P171_9EURY|nr:iron ABC transporter permease [Thermococcus nautili]AHL22496.1 ABC-type Fe3+-siderophore transport system, permease component [Thermococcus nautili]
MRGRGVLLLALFVFLTSPFVGRMHFSPFGMGELEKAVLLNVRLPRVVASALVGASLSLAGLTFQNVFRNPLAGPNLLGVTSGAAFGAVLAILLGFGGLLIQFSAFLFGVLAVFIVWRLSKLIGDGLLGLVLAGIAVSAFFSSLVGFAKYLADPYDKLQEIVYWLLGSFAGLRWENLWPMLPPLAVSIVGIVLLRWSLNVLSLSEEEAKALGLNVSLYRRFLVLLAALGVSASTAMAGMIGWVGLVSPHIARLLVGHDNRALAPVSALVGASMLAFCDDIARSLATFELPLGVVTSLIGAPVLVAILARRRWHVKG